MRLLPLGLINVHGKQSKLLKGERILEELAVTKIVIIDYDPSEFVMNLDLFSHHEFNSDSHNGLLHVFGHIDTFLQVSTRILGFECIIGNPKVVIEASIKILQMDFAQLGFCHVRLDLSLHLFAVQVWVCLHLEF